MEEIDNKQYNKFVSQFIEPKKYTIKLNEYEETMQSLLNEFKDKYVLFKLYTNDEEIKQNYENILSNIQFVETNMFNMSNDIKININKLNKYLLELNSAISKKKQINKTLKKKLANIENQNNSSSEMFYDYKDIYDTNYLRNWSLALSSILCIFIIKVIYKSNT